MHFTQIFSRVIQAICLTFEFELQLMMTVISFLFDLLKIPFSCFLLLRYDFYKKCINKCITNEVHYRHTRLNIHYEDNFIDYM